MDCKTCEIPDVNCYEQCRGCFGASFGDCFDCPHYGNIIMKKEDIVSNKRSEEGEDDVREMS